MTPTEPFTDEELTNLSDQIDAELRQLQTTGSDGQHLGVSSFEGIPRCQRIVIREATGEEAAIFLARFVAVANRELCHRDGVLYKTWRRCNDIENKPLLRATGIAALTLGVSSSVLGTVAVAITVCILYFSYKTFCTESPRFKCSALALLRQIVTDDSDKNKHLLSRAFGNIDHWAGMPLITYGTPSDLAPHWLAALWNHQCIDGEHQLARLLRVAFEFRPTHDCDCLGGFQGLLAYLDASCIDLSGSEHPMSQSLLLDEALVPDPDADNELGSSDSLTIVDSELEGARIQLVQTPAEQIDIAGRPGITIAMTAIFHAPPATRFTHAQIRAHLISPENAIYDQFAPEPQPNAPQLVKVSGAGSARALWTFSESPAVRKGLEHSTRLKFTLLGAPPFTAEIFIAASLIKPGIAGLVDRVRHMVIGPRLSGPPRHQITWGLHASAKPTICRGTSRSFPPDTDAPPQSCLAQIWEGTKGWFKAGGEDPWTNGLLCHELRLKEAIELETIERIRTSWGDLDLLQKAPGLRDQIQFLNAKAGSMPSAELHRCLVKCWFPWMPDVWWEDQKDPERIPERIHTSLKTIIGKDAAVYSNDGKFWPSLGGVYIVLCHTLWKHLQNDDQKLKNLLDPGWSTITSGNAKQAKWPPLQHLVDRTLHLRWLEGLFSAIFFHKDEPQRLNIDKVEFGDKGRSLTLHTNDPDLFANLWNAAIDERDKFIHESQLLCSLGSARGYFLRLMLSGPNSISWKREEPGQLILLGEV